jgi:hypothetical protein
MAPRPAFRMTEPIARFYTASRHSAVMTFVGKGESFDTSRPPKGRLMDIVVTVALIEILHMLLSRPWIVL